MLFQIESMWQILGWVLVFAGLIITNEIARQTKKGGIAPPSCDHFLATVGMGISS